MNQTRTAFILMSLALTGVLVAPVASSPQAPHATADRIANAPAPGTRAPDFELPGLDGKPVSLSSLRGKVVLLEFTATWCPACYQAASDLRKLKRQFGTALSLISISLDGGENTDTTREDLLRFVRQEKVDWPVLFDDTGTDNSAALAYGIERLPAYVLIDQSGVIRFNSHGAGVSRAIEKKVRGLLSAPPKN